MITCLSECCNTHLLYFILSIKRRRYIENLQITMIHSTDRENVEELLQVLEEHFPNRKASNLEICWL